jgi:hypothetical protein
MRIGQYAPENDVNGSAGQSRELDVIFMPTDSGKQFWLDRACTKPYYFGTVYGLAYVETMKLHGPFWGYKLQDEKIAS